LIDQIKKKIDEGNFSIAVIGLGYVGLPLAVAFAKRGFKVVGIDTNTDKVKMLNSGISYVPDVPTEEVERLRNNGNLSATVDSTVLKESDAVMICVPTPLSKTRDPDLNYIVAAVRELRKYLRKGHLVSLESTTYPGTTEELVKPLLEESGLKEGEDFYLAFSPERIDPGNKVFTFENTPKVVGGVSPNSTEIISYLYGKVLEKVVPVSSAKVAEMAKLLENTFRSVNIALANEMAIMCNILGVDVWEVIEAAGTKPFGFMKFYPGPGIGGHCIPIDPLYLSWKLKTLNYNARFIQLASEINTNMPRYVVERIADALNAVSKSVNGSKILILGVSYKKDVSDTRESPALDIIELLENKGAMVTYHDPLVPEVFANGRMRKSIDLTEGSLRNSDCVVITTDHSDVDYKKVFSLAPLVVDTKNASRLVPPGDIKAKVVKL
jgi:UDP-N-acetyl-D-glucosamine dehydrogenase